MALGDLAAGPFSGEWQITVFCRAPAIQLEAVVTTREEHRAFLYDMGLMGGLLKGLAWADTEGGVLKAPADPVT